MTLQDLLDEVPAPTVPGALATVISDDGAVWTGASDGTDPAAPFRCASVTKTFTAAAVLRLVENGDLSLDRRIELDGRGTVTIEQLLRHSSGLADHTEDPTYVAAIRAEPQRHWTRAEQVAGALAMAPIGPAGKQVSYSDTGYVILGGLLEELTGATFPAALRQLLPLTELGLRTSWVEELEPEPAGVPLRARQLLGDLDTREVHGSMDLWGGGGLVTSTLDLALFFRGLLDGQVLRPATLTAMTTVTDLPGNERRMGMGIFPLPTGQDGWWGHSGYWNVVAGARLGTRAAVAVAVLQKDEPAPPAPELAARLVQHGSAG